MIFTFFLKKLIFSKLFSYKLFLVGQLMNPANENNLSTGVEE